MPTPALPRLSPTLLAILASGALLSGCDLWGGSEPTNNATASSAEDPVVIAQMEEASSISSGSYLFGKTNVTGVGSSDPDGPVTLLGQQLHIIDPSTGTEAVSVPIQVDADSTQLVSQSFTPSSDGLSQQANNINNTLFFTDGHKLFKISLMPSAAGFQQQVSSEAQICQLIKAIPKDANATSSWIVLTATRTANGDCAQAADVVTKVVDADAADNVAASNADQLSQVLAVQRDAQGNLLGVLGLAPAPSGQTSRALVVMQPDGSVTTLNFNLAAGQSASYFDRVAGSTTQAYLRVTNDTGGVQLVAVDWATGTPSLSRTPAATLTVGDAVFVHADAQANYFVDGFSLQSLNAQSGALTTLATLSKGVAQPGGVMTTSYLVVPQLDNDTGTLSLQAFSKTTANSVRNITPPQTLGTLRVEARNGDVLIVSNTFVADPTQADTQPETTLWRVDLNPRVIAYTRLGDQATVISTTQAASESITGEQQQAFVLWSHALNDGTLSVSSYQLPTSQTYVLASGVPAWDLAQTTSGNIAQGLLTATTGTTDTLWSFDAGKAGSLVQVQGNTGQ